MKDGYLEISQLPNKSHIVQVLGKARDMIKIRESSRQISD